MSSNPCSVNLNESGHRICERGHLVSDLECVEVRVANESAPLVDLAFEMLEYNPARTELTLQRTVSYQFFCPDSREAAALAERLTAHLATWRVPGTHAVQRRTLQREEWAESWKKFFRLEVISDRLAIRPSWIAGDAAEGRVDVIIDPGMSFGTGQHFTTRSCLSALDCLVHSRCAPSLLDVGCGSGILSIAGACLGCRPVLGLDIDPAAVEVAEENARLNGVSGKAVFRQADTVDAAELGTYDVVTANIFSDTLIELAEKLKGVLKKAPESRLVLSGILAPQSGAVVEAYRACGIIEDSRLEDREWVTLVCRHGHA